MKNSRYLEEAVAGLRAENALPDLDDRTIIALVERVYDRTQAVAFENSSDLTLNTIDDETLMMAFRRAHELDITFNEFMEKLLLDLINEQSNIAE